MASDLTRRGFLAGGIAGTAVAAATAQVAGADAPRPQAGKTIKILGISTSFRKGKTTAAGVQACLEAAKAVDPAGIEIELIDLADMQIHAEVAAGIPLAPGEKDDFLALVPKLADPKVAGIIIGSPIYFSNLSSLCKAFLERCMTFRKDNFSLSNKVGGALAVGAGRNGGGELTIRSIHTSMFSQEMIVVGESRPTAHFGPVLVNTKDDISKDEIGLKAVANLGRRVAEVARRLSK